MILESSYSYNIIAFFSMENQLADFERRYKVLCRWRVDDKEFIDARKSFFEYNRNQLYSSLWSVVVRRHYLIKMKAKYAG